jgi:AraC-like DNA-binding protein
VFLHGIAALEVGGQGLCLQSLPGKAEWSCSFVPGWRGVLLLDQRACHVVSGSAACKIGDISVLTKMQALLDEDRGIEIKAGAETVHVVQVAGDGMAVLADRRATERWFLDKVFYAEPLAVLISALLRRMECYSLVRFLLACPDDNLRALAERYGVSYTHFRRLCNYALGGSAKAELNNWRMARSLLDLACGSSTVTEVALKHGYASGSHFSNDVREQVGVSPRVLSDILNLTDK